MSILTKIEDKDKAVKARSERVNAGVAHAAQVLHESSLGRRCPNLLKGIESESAEAKYQAATLVQLMENTAEYVQKMDGINLLTEADAYGNAATNAVSLLSPGVTTLTPKVVDIVNVFYPMMCGQYIADIQALDRQSGQIFTIKTRYSQKAAGVEAGDIVFEEPTDGTYTSEYVGYGSVAMTEEGVVEAAPSSALPADASVKIRAGSFIVRVAGKEVARDYGNGAAKVDGVNNGKYGIFGRGVSGELDAQSGEATVKFDKEMFADAITAKAVVSFEAAVDTETDVDLIRKIQFDIPNTPILAKEHPLMSSYSVAASLVMNAHLAIDTDELIANQIAGTIRWERDLLLIKAVSDAAVINPYLNFDCAGNGENLTLQQRYSAFTTHVSAARGIIQETAGRGTVEFIICSAKEGLTVIEQMEDFKAAPESKKPIGPYLAGTLREGTINVVAVPYTKTLAADEVIFGFKGFQLGDSAIILAEWIPLYFTPTFQAPNLKNHKGALSFYDLFINKPEYLVKGYLKNFNQA
ncbi:hypothetical protein IKN40_08705 [bacterium]|nr:hypothetical protein [Clostridia bacterium]MBR4617933.1 hypothetical protein [Bacilli bacterium]MBR6908498.1 hypothetical protein [bacterium]